VGDVGHHAGGEFETVYRIVIVGGGLAGAACALHLLRDHPGLRAEVIIVEPRAVLGAGLAYSTPAREHRTNVAASRMSLFAEEPLHFHDWVRARGAPADDPASEMADGRLYPSRAVFGRYVEAMLGAEIAAHAGVAFRHVRAMATGILPEGAGFRVSLAEGGPLAADAVVLAVSHTAPDLPAPLRGVGHVIADPWNVGALAGVPSEARVLIVGTGLTACDVVATLIARGHRGAVTAISRHGLLPRPRTLLPVEAEGDFTDALETTALGLLRRIRRVVAAAQAAGRPWENVVDALRQQAVVVWGTLDWTERRRMLRHARAFWDVHRFQSAPQIDAVVAAARAAGRLSVRAGSVIDAAETAGGVRVRVRPRGAPVGLCETLLVDAVINCTGPGHRSVVKTHPVLAGLAAAGGLQADPARLGILVDGAARVVRADGTAWENLFVAGPLARGTFGELMGLPQVNTQPRGVAVLVAALAAAA
jgi:uncharacterized NAD(P)/FAD-binding protein YdhS